ncbi:MAG: DUF4397 domain-containing protein [Chloroflexi bacterium]|nr:DUF4397 domain-containing protein [Chloroflexota bacterium]
MAELVVFIVFGALAVAAAALMLLSENAVHSALFLIVTMGCIALLFLALNAPFLAMIQITVYAGAIMVLFLFVIMLLGAERADPGEPYAEPGPGGLRFRWFTPVALALALSLLVAVGLTVLQTQVDNLALPTPEPAVRVVNIAPGSGPIDAYVGETLVAAGVAPADQSPFTPLAAGDYVLTVGLPDGSSTSTDIALAPATQYTVLAYGLDDVPGLAVTTTDVSAITAPEPSGRLQIFNAYPEPISLVDPGDELVEDDTRVIIPEIAAGAFAEPQVLAEGTLLWAFTSADQITTLLNLRDYTINRDTNQLLIVNAERNFAGALVASATTVSDEARPSFGGPTAIGYMLFTEYLLPFLLLAVLLLAAMVGAIVLTHREVERRQRAAGRRRVSRPLPAVIAAQVGGESNGGNGSATAQPLPDPSDEPR